MAIHFEDAIEKIKKDLKTPRLLYIATYMPDLSSCRDYFLIQYQWVIWISQWRICVIV